MRLRILALALILAGCASGGGNKADAGDAPQHGIAVGEPNPSAPGGLQLPGAPSSSAGAPKAPGGISKADKKIDLGEWRGAQNPDDLSAAFSAQIDARYGPEPDLKQVRADLTSNGFTCKDVAPVEARADYLIATCERQEMHQSCGNIWSVALRRDHLAAAEGEGRIIPRGGFERLCLGANPPK
jgi:hypothetical protein